MFVIMNKYLILYDNFVRNFCNLFTDQCTARLEGLGFESRPREGALLTGDLLFLSVRSQKCCDNSLKLKTTTYFNILTILQFIFILHFTCFFICTVNSR